MKQRGRPLAVWDRVTLSAPNLMAKWEAEFGSNNRKNFGESLKEITVAFPERKTQEQCVLHTFRDHFKNMLKAKGCAFRGHPAECPDPG